MTDDIGRDAIFDTTFHLQRVTPLHIHGSDTNITSPSNLKLHSTRLTNLIRGDVLRGVRVQNENSVEPSTNTGMLEKVTFGNFPATSPEETIGNGVHGISITFNYVKKSYTALLLRDSKATGSQSNTRRRNPSRRANNDNSNHFPLLVYHLPASITSIFLDYLTTTFDCHISPLRTSPGFVMKVLEKYMESFITSQDETSQVKPTKDISLTFETLSSLWETSDKTTSDKVEKQNKKLQTLRTITLVIPKNDILGFLYHGRKSSARATAKGVMSEGPFECALKAYLFSTSAIHLEKLHMQKVSCAPFVFGEAADGSARCKLFKVARIDDQDEGTVVRHLMLEELIGEAAKTVV